MGAGDDQAGVTASGVATVGVQAAGVPAVLDGGPGDDALRAPVADGVRVSGGDGDDTITVTPPYGSGAPAGVTVPIACGAGKDRVNHGMVLDMRITHGPGQFDGDVRPGLALAPDCPPVPATFPYYLETEARKGRTASGGSAHRSRSSCASPRSAASSVPTSSRARRA